MRFGLFYEHQLPRPWEDGAEERLLGDALEQVELADRRGFDYVWEVEHHFLEEYSHSSAPEVFLAAASQRTKNIRLGHGIVQTPPPFNHPAEAKHWVDDYYTTLAREGVPMGDAVNANIACVTTFMCHPDEDVALA